MRVPIGVRGGHQQGVARFSRMIAEEMGLADDEVDVIEVSALVHDIGKLAVPAEILTRAGRLSNAEFTLIKVHAQAGYDILKDIDIGSHVADIALPHHQRIDGSGYPSGLSGGSIPVGARIVVVADALEAMASHRPYRPALGIEAAMAEITGHPEKFDADVVSACVRLHETGRIAV